MPHNSQASLFDTATPPDQPSAPTCRMCPRLARWLPKQNTYGMYCAGGHCNNRERICQSCVKPFHVNTDGAGTKYCSTDCKRTGYTVALKTRPPCAWCGKVGDDKRRSHRGGWSYICRDCMEPIKHLEARLKKHHVSADRARALIADPHCECCGIDIVAKVRDTGTGRTEIDDRLFRQAG